MYTSLSKSPKTQNVSSEKKTEITNFSFRARTKSIPKIDSNILFQQYSKEIQSLEISEETTEYYNLVPFTQSQKEELDPQKIMTEKIVDFISVNPHKIHDLNFFGENLLHEAIEQNNINSVRYLLTCGASPNTPNEITDQSPLQMAENMKNDEIKKLLVSFGARSGLRKFV